MPNVNFAHYFQLPDEETKVWGYLNNLSLICSFIHSEVIKHLQCVWWCGFKANILEFVVALRSSGRVGSKSPGYLVSNPVVHPGNYHTMQQNMLLWHFQKQNARLDGCLMFHKMPFMCYIVIFLYLLLNSWIKLIKAKCCSRNIL